MAMTCPVRNRNGPVRGGPRSRLSRETVPGPWFPPCENPSPAGSMHARAMENVRSLQDTNAAGPTRVCQPTVARALP